MESQQEGGREKKTALLSVLFTVATTSVLLKKWNVGIFVTEIILHSLPSGGSEFSA
jgi:hypothetical protein